MKKIKVGVAGCGALGSIVAKALQEGIDGYDFVGISDLDAPDFGVPNMDFTDLADSCDLVIEALPPKIVPTLAHEVLGCDVDLMLLSACSLLLYPEILDMAKTSQGRMMMSSGAIAGLDAISALNCAKIDSATISTTKPPAGLKGAPYIVSENIDLGKIEEATLIFRGNALEAAKAFPANVNVAATLSFASIGPERTQVEVWADPSIKGNRHDIVVVGGTSTIRTSVENVPEPSNPKSSMLAGYSVIATLKKRTGKLVVL